MTPAETEPGQTAGDVGEFALIERLRAKVPAAGPGVILGIGDDTAVLSVDGPVLATCDIQVEGIHFDRAVCGAEDIGWRALAANLSDIAAMGGTPRFVLISLAVPAEAPLALLDGIYAGIAELGSAYDVVVVGGNVSGTPGPLTIDITLLGTAGRVVPRSGAHPGDGIWITGTAGKAAAGLYLLRHPALRVPARDSLVAAYRRPIPRVRVGQMLAGLAAVTAMIDTSDGTGSDLLHLADASGVGSVLMLEQVPLAEGLRETVQAAGRDPAAWALGGGEDYELLFTAGPAFDPTAGEFMRATGIALTRVGDVRPVREGNWLLGPRGERTPLTPVGWDHFRR
jgi:thiamine-monophosphate kinase